VELDNAAFQPAVLGGAHTDVSADGYLDQFRQLVPEDHELGMPSPGKKRRVVFLKFWRSIVEAPVANHHLAVLDKSSLRDSDIHEGESNFKGFKIKQNRLNGDVDADGLRWVYFPNMQRDELICFQQGDLTMHSAGCNGQSSKITFPEHRQDHATFHTAFEDPMAPAGVAPRQSIETAVYVFFPEEPETLSKL